MLYIWHRSHPTTMTEPCRRPEQSVHGMRTRQTPSRGTSGHRRCPVPPAGLHTLNQRPPLQTGSSAFLLPNPDLSTAIPIYGPTTGTLRAKAAMVPRKSPKRTAMPYSSMQKPMSVHRRRMRTRPPKKAAVPRAFCFRAKKRRVFWGPIIIVRPMRKRIWWWG